MKLVNMIKQYHFSMNYCIYCAHSCWALLLYEHMQMIRQTW